MNDEPINMFIVDLIDIMIYTPAFGSTPARYNPIDQDGADCLLAVLIRSGCLFPDEYDWNVIVQRMTSSLINLGFKTNEFRFDNKDKTSIGIAFEDYERFCKFYQFCVKIIDMSYDRYVSDGFTFQITPAPSVIVYDDDDNNVLATIGPAHDSIHAVRIADQQEVLVPSTDYKVVEASTPTEEIVTVQMYNAVPFDTVVYDQIAQECAFKYTGMDTMELGFYRTDNKNAAHIVAFNNRYADDKYAKPINCRRLVGMYNILREGIGVKFNDSSHPPFQRTRRLRINSMIRDDLPYQLLRTLALRTGFRQMLKYVKRFMSVRARYRFRVINSRQSHPGCQPNVLNSGLCICYALKFNT